MASEKQYPEFRVILHNGHAGKVHLLFSGTPSDVAEGMLVAMRSSVPFKAALVMAVSDLLEKSHPHLSGDLVNVVKQIIPELQATLDQNKYN